VLVLVLVLVLVVVLLLLLVLLQMFLRGTCLALEWVQLPLVWEISPGNCGVLESVLVLKLKLKLVLVHRQTALAICVVLVWLVVPALGLETFPEMVFVLEQFWVLWLALEVDWEISLVIVCVILPLPLALPPL